MVNNDDTKVRYRGNGSTRVFPITFPFTENDYICVRIANDETGEVEELESDFLVDNIANTVTYPGWVSGQEPPVASQPAVLTSDETITIYRKTEISQLTELGIKFPLPQIEHALDKITNILQEHDEAIVRSVKVDISSDEEAGYYYERMMVASENAVNAATAAATSQASASASATAAAASAATAASEATAASTSATAAAISATAAANSATAAANSATAAANSATSAATSATAAANSATAAANSATAAANSATAAANSQSAAASSATSAAALEESSRTNAQVASSAATSCSQILPQVVAAKISAENSASAANTAKVAAALSAASAETDAQTASNAASTATTKAGEASASALAAATSAASAADSATAASTSYDQAAVAVVNILDIVAEAAVTYPAQSGTQAYTGSVQTPNWDSYYQPNKMVITGDTSATNAGTYTVTFTPKPGYYWLADDTTTAKTQTWTISRATVANVPAQSNVLVYDGTAQTPTWSNYDSGQLTISGDTSATEAGTYTATFTPTANYKWYDGTTTAKSVTWTINAATVTIPTVTNTSKTYNGQSQAPTVTGLDALTVDVIDDASATDAGSYMITFHLKSASLHWSDLTTADKSVAWTISPKSVTAPTVTDTSKTYNGDSQGPTISSFDSNEIVMSGTSSAVTAGSYSVIFSLASAINYVWSDTTTAAKSVSWSIAKLAGSMSLSKNSMSLDMNNLTDTITVTRAGDGAITATSANTSIATTSVSGNIVTITAVANGNTTVTIGVAEGANYLAPDTQTVIVSAVLTNIMTVYIDLSDSNPDTCCTYGDDALGMTPGSDEWDDFFGHYPCMLLNGVEGQKLQRNNFNLHEDGTSADITSGSEGDVMIAFPRRGLKMSTSGSIVTISMTNDPNDSNFEYMAHKRGSTLKDKFYLGAYKGSVVSSKLRSLSGKPCAIKNRSESRTLARANGGSDGNGGSGYDQSGWYQLIYRQCMYILKYKSLDSQSKVGRGFVDGNSAQKDTGGTETKGMDWGETTGKDHMKLFGIEDFWGNVYEWIDGIYSDTGRNILTGTQGFNDTGSGYTDRGQGATSDLDNYISKIHGDTYKGFVVKEVQGSATTYFCDLAILYPNRSAFYGGRWNLGDRAGVFQMSVSGSADIYNAYYGARLMYV